MHILKWMETCPTKRGAVLFCLLMAMGLFSGGGLAAPAVDDPVGNEAANDVKASAEQKATQEKKSSKKCEVVVMNLKPRGIPKDQEYVVEILTNSMAAEIAQSAGCKVISEEDIKSMMDFEATKAACGAGSDSCMAEIGSALGVDLVIGGVVGQLGSSFTLQAMLRDVRKGEVIARFNETVKGDPELLNHAAKNAGRALFKMELLPAIASSTTAPTTGGVTSVAAAESEGRGMGFMTLGGFGLAGVGLVAAGIGGVLALWMNAQAADINAGQGSEKDYAPTQMWGLIGLGVAAGGLVVGLVGAGAGALGMME